MRKNKLALLFSLTTLSLSALGLSGTGHAQEACPDPTPHAEATPGPTPTPSPKAWDAGSGIGVVLDADGTPATDDDGHAIVDGRMTAPQDQTVPEAQRKTPKVKVGGTLDCAVESASDYDHWQKDDNDGNDCTKGEEGNEADTVTYHWSGSGTFDTPDSASATWTAPTQPGHYTLTCDIDDTPTSVTAPETGDRGDTKISVSCEVVVYKLSVQFVNDEVAAGAVGNAAHQSDFNVIATDGQNPVADVEVDAPEITAGGLGGDDEVTASISFPQDAKTDGDGKAKGTFTSGNRTETTTISIDDSSDSIEQVWNSESDPWSYEPYFDYDEPSTITYTMSYSRGPITGHSMTPTTTAISGYVWNSEIGEDWDEDGRPDGDYEVVSYSDSDEDTSGLDSASSSVGWGGVSETDGSYSVDQTIYWNDDFIVDSVSFWLYDNSAYDADGN